MSTHLQASSGPGKGAQKKASEMIMSTLSLRAEDMAAAAADTETERTKPSLFQRLIKAREEEARRRVRMYLVAMDDERLMSLGFSEDDIRALRSGEARLPSAATNSTGKAPAGGAS